MLRWASLAFILLMPGGASASPASTLAVCDDVQDPASLNPYLVFSEKTHTLLQQMLEGLVRFDSKGGIEPALAESWERIDPLTIRFHLRKGVTFHNGESFDARSVKFSLEKYVDPQTHYPGAGFVETISSVAIIDDDTVDVITRRPDGLLLNRLAAWMHVVPRLYYQQKGDEGFARHPIGTGPFQFQSWEKGKRIVLSANRRYWMKGYPRVDSLSFEFIPSEKQVDALLAGDVDILTNLPGTKTLDVQESSTTFVMKQPAYYTVVGNFNVSHKILSDQRIREALNLGIDRKALVRYDLLGNGRPIGTLTFPGESGHDSRLAPYPYDPVKAKRILAREGYPQGFTLKVLLKVNAARTGQIIAKQLERIGVRLDMTPMTDAQIFDLMKDRDQWDMLIADCPDPMYDGFFIRTVFLGGLSPFSLSNVPEIDRRLDQLTRTLDVRRRQKLSEELDDYIHSEFWAIPTYQRIRTYGLRRGVAFTPAVSGMSYFYTAVNHGAKAF